MRIGGGHAAVDADFSIELGSKAVHAAPDDADLRLCYRLERPSH
jgi:hypothetical protein